MTGPRPLAQLGPKLYRREARVDGVFHVKTRSLRRAHGLLFLCPRCFERNAGPIGTHSVICWFRGRVPDDAQPGPGRWDVAGTSLRDITLAPSIQLIGGCAWHGYVRDGTAIGA